jgi:hypothetical protein
MNNNISKQPAKKRGRPPGSKNKPKGPAFLDAVQQKISEQKKQSGAVIVAAASLPPKQETPTPPVITPPVVVQPAVVIPTVVKKQQPQQQQVAQFDPTQVKNYKQYQLGDRVRKTTDEEIGYVKLHRENTRYVYVDWGGDYMNWVPVDLLQSAPIIPKKHKK